MYILHTTCPECGVLHAVQVLPALAQPASIRDELREQLANLHEAIGSALALLRQGDRSAGMALLEEAMGGKR